MMGTGEPRVRWLDERNTSHGGAPFASIDAAWLHGVCHCVDGQRASRLAVTQSGVNSKATAGSGCTNLFFLPA